MAKQIIVIALIFFAAVGMASASTVDAPPLASIATALDGLVEGPIGESTDDTIGTITGGSTAIDAAPLGGPVPDGVFLDLTPAPAPASSTATLGVTTVAGAIAAAGVVVSLFI